MADKKGIFFFHWTKSLDRHTKQITPEFHDWHKALYYEYKKTTSLEEVNLRYVTIWSWWYSFKATSEGAMFMSSTIGLIFGTFVCDNGEGAMLNVNSSKLLYLIFIFHMSFMNYIFF
jgi:hypothetical protein